MAWNEPGNSNGNDKDPWGGKNNDNPPDLDEVVKKIQDKVTHIFGGKGSKGKGGGNGGAALPGGGGLLFGAVFVVLGGLWASSGFYTIDEAERGVVLRLGAYSTITQPGLHWHFPTPIETVERVNVQNIRNEEIGYRSGGGRARDSERTVGSEALMLTEDENIIDINFAVQYRVRDAKEYLFNVRDPRITLKQATESAVREVIGKTRMDFILTEGRGEISEKARVLIQGILDRYNTGLEVTSVNMQDAQPPEEVQDAFHDAVKAREDEERYKNEAEAYANGILPRARGAAARQIEEANAYKAQVIAEAEGEATRFKTVLAEYKKAPEVTRERMYIDSMESVMTKSSKVILDTSSGNSLLYLPIDQLVNRANKAVSATMKNVDNEINIPTTTSSREPKNRRPSRPTRIDSQRGVR